MEQAKEFILKFLDKEAECWTKRRSSDLDGFNESVRELYAMAIEDLDEGLGIHYREELTFQEEVSYKPRHLYKLSSYNNKIYGDVWVAYTSIKNTIGGPEKSLIAEGFIIAKIENDLKIIGTMLSYKNRSTMEIIGWKASVYNPESLNIKKLGKFTATDRYTEPGNYDNWSLNEYLKES